MREILKRKANLEIIAQQFYFPIVDIDNLEGREEAHGHYATHRFILLADIGQI